MPTALTAADGLVPLLTLRGTQCGDEQRDDGLQEADLRRQPNDLWVDEQVVQKGLHIVEFVWSPQIEKQHAHFLGGEGSMLRPNIGARAEVCEGNICIWVEPHIGSSQRGQSGEQPASRR